MTTCRNERRGVLLLMTVKLDAEDSEWSAEYFRSLSATACHRRLLLLLRAGKTTLGLSFYTTTNRARISQNRLW